MNRIPGVLFTLVVAVAIAPLAAQEPSARFEVDTRILDVGEVVRGEVVEATFTIGNSGDATLEIIDAVPG